MKGLKRLMTATLVAAVLAAGCFAQKNGDSNRPPKDNNPKVVVKPKNDQKNDNKGNSNRRGGP